MKNIFVIFKGLSIARNCLRPESAPLKDTFRPFYLLTLNKVLLLYRWCPIGWDGSIDPKFSLFFHLDW